MARTANSKKSTDTGTTGRTAEKSEFLQALGERVRALRSRQGMSRKALSQATGVSERHLANLEYGEGNASILVLDEVSGALNCSLAELTGDLTTSSPEWLMIRSLLENCDERALHTARLAITKALSGQAQQNATANSRIALIGLRGAGKSTLGAMLAEELDFPFVELSREIEKFAGCSIAEIQDLYGVNAYRRYERRALEETIQIYPEAIIGTPGGLVSDPVNFNLLLSHCTTIWLQAAPDDHMERVMEQGDFRPMSGNREAMEDLKGILKSRQAFYSKAQYALDTSDKSLEETYAELKVMVEGILG
ncbi:MAG: helix-turn-helix transcriptional regulator [Thiolinea sp.]